MWNERKNRNRAWMSPALSCVCPLARFVEDKTSGSVIATEDVFTYLPEAEFVQVPEETLAQLRRVARELSSEQPS